MIIIYFLGVTSTTELKTSHQLSYPNDFFQNVIEFPTRCPVRQSHELPSKVLVMFVAGCFSDCAMNQEKDPFRNIGHLFELAACIQIKCLQSHYREQRRAFLKSTMQMSIHRHDVRLTVFFFACFLSAPSQRPPGEAGPSARSLLGSLQRDGLVPGPEQKKGLRPEMTRRRG